MAGNRVLLAALFAAIAIAAAIGALLLRSGPPTAPETAAEMAGAPVGAPSEGFVALYPAPDLAVVAPLDPAGQPADMAPYRGKALLVNFWATWCAPCIEELPSLGKLQAALGGPDFAVVAIALDEPQPAKIVDFLREHGAGNLPALIDTNRTVDQALPIAALPTSLLVDRQGKVRAAFTGDARWHCGKALSAVRAFVKDGTVSGDALEECE